MTRMIVGVIRGGTSGEYPLSLKTGAAILNALPEERYETRDILIDKTGTWHLRGMPSTPTRALSQLDVVLNALHGGVGEDGTVQRLLDQMAIPYAGARPTASSIALNKVRARETLRAAGVRMPRAVSFSAQNVQTAPDMARSVFTQFGPPYIVKPSSEGAGRGIQVASGIIELPDAIADVMESFGNVLVEEYIRGQEASVGVIEGFRNEQLYVLPPAHVKRTGPHLNFEMHESGAIEHSVPSSFTHIQKLNIEDIARVAHTALGISHFSRSDVIVTPHAVYLLEVNTTPGLYPGASFPQMLESVGSSVTEFLEHAISLARSHR